MKGHLVLFVYLIGGAFATSANAYANNFPYKKYAFGRAAAEGDSNNDGFLKNHMSDLGNNLNAAADVGNFYKLDNNLNAHDLHNLKKGLSSDSLKHTVGENFENDKSHNRKNIKSGFSNSYHKDENGSRSSYYEDSDDHGGKKVYDKRDGLHGDDFISKIDEGFRNGAVRDKYDDRRTAFDTRGMRDQHHLLAEDQGNRHGYRDGYHGGEAAELEIVNHPFDRFNEFEPRYRGPAPMMSSNYRQPLNSYRSKITIFEDPREFMDPQNDRSEWLRRRNDFVAINREYRSPVLRYRSRSDSDRDIFNRFRDY